jgi:hypothetical protein
MIIDVFIFQIHASLKLATRLLIVLLRLTTAQCVNADHDALN